MHGALLFVLVLLLGVAAIDIWRRGYSSFISWPRLLLLYIVYQLASLKRYQMYRQFQRDVRHFDEVQSKFLLGRIRRCENSSYARDHGFDAVRTVPDFRRTQPVTDYYHFKPYIDRMADEGDKLALLGEQDEIRMFITSSGTTGKNKRIPISMQGTRDFQLHMVRGAYNYHVTTILGPWDLRRMANISNGRTPEYTKAGYSLGVASTVLYDKLGTLFQDVYTSPAVSLEVKSEFESHYIHMLFALRDKELSCVICGFIHNFLTMMRRMKVYQKELVADVRRGRIKEDLDIPAEIRTALNGRLTPMPDRADEIEREFGRGFHSIIPRLWPHVTRITGIWSGSTNEIYHREAKTLLGPDVLIMSYSYCASEGLFSMNMSLSHSGQPRYTLLPSTNFYEFLPIHNDKIPETEDIDPEQLLLATELEVGQTYEMVVTNASGFYRYRVGDVVRVVDFYQQAPQLEFLYRAGQSLNVNGEKLSEEVFIRALRSAAASWPVQLQDYTVAGSQFAPHRDGLLNPHYLVFFEAEGGELTDQQLAMVDSTLRDQDDEYASFRSLGKIADMKLYRMPSGSFASFKQYLLKTKKTAPTQFKMPRVLKSRDAVDWLLDHL